MEEDCGDTSSIIRGFIPLEGFIETGEALQKVPFPTLDDGKVDQKLWRTYRAIRLWRCRFATGLHRMLVKTGFISRATALKPLTRSPTVALHMIAVGLCAGSVFQHLVISS